MGFLWLWTFKFPIGPEGLTRAIYLLLIIPGGLVALPSMLLQGHSFWNGWLVVGAILNWLLYAQIIFMLVHWRNRKKRLGGTTAAAR